MAFFEYNRSALYVFTSFIEPYDDRFHDDNYHDYESY